ncbi:MAG: M23 family metallopeptidase [Terriglobales bacterium]
MPNYRPEITPVSASLVSSVLLQMIRTISKYFLLFSLTAILSGHGASAEDALSVHWQPSRLVNGSPIIFQVAAPTHLRSLAGKWLDHDVYFAFDPHSRKWFAIAGVSLETKPDSYRLRLDGITSRGTKISFVRRIVVTRASYASIAITVPTKFTEPNPEQLKKALEDKTLKQDIFSQINPLKEWSGDFEPPVNAPVSGLFGTQRTFNGEVQSTHQGLDYAVPEGTQVSAMNSGVVLVARPMYFEGNCVMLDHGQGLLTIYMHLSDFKVKEGEQVKRGQLIGLSGGTGRATGPHLHVAVRWEGIYVDPAKLLQLKVP